MILVKKEILNSARRVCISSDHIQPQWLLSIAWTYSQCNPEYNKYIGDALWASKICSSDPALLLLAGSTVGMFCRPALDVLNHSKQMGKPMHWNAVFTHYMNNLDKQFSMELAALERLWNPQLYGLEELLNLYFGGRMGYTKVISQLPQTATALEANDQIKELLKRIENESCSTSETSSTSAG